MTDKKALRAIGYGLYLLGARTPEKANACVINTFMRLASDPLTVSIASTKTGYTHDMIMASGRFTISVLTVNAPYSLYENFGMKSGRDTDKLNGVSGVKYDVNGVPYFTEGTNARFSCRVITSHDFGSHTLFTAEVTESEVLSSEDSVTYAYYQKYVKPRPEPVKEEKSGWKCSVCGYIHESEDLPDQIAWDLTLLRAQNETFLYTTLREQALANSDSMN